MNKHIFIAISEHLEQQVPELRWIDEQQGQLDHERPPITYPAALISIAYPDCETIAREKQRVSATLSLQIVFSITGATSNCTPKAIREKSLQRLDVLQKIHQALQYWNANKLFTPMERVRQMPQKNTADYKVYELNYRFRLID